jgi:hypothetical protein
MDTSGAFSFDRIVKTLLPGLVLLLLLLPYVGRVSGALGSPFRVQDVLVSSEVFLVFLGSGFSILLGLLLNAIVFSAVFPYLWDRYCTTTRIERLTRIREACIEYRYRQTLRDYPGVELADVKAFRHAESLVNPESYRSLTRRFNDYAVFQLNMSLLSVLAAASFTFHAFVDSEQASPLSPSARVSATISVVAALLITAYGLARVGFKNYRLYRERELELWILEFLRHSSPSSVLIPGNDSD